jgi:hypothetical protein
LADDAEGEISLELAATRREHPRVVRFGQVLELSEQARLADAGLTLDKQQAPAPASRVLEQSGEL